MERIKASEKDGNYVTRQDTWGHTYGAGMGHTWGRYKTAGQVLNCIGAGITLHRDSIIRERIGTRISMYWYIDI